MLTSSVAQIMIFAFSIASPMIPKIIALTIENLSIPANTAHRVVLEKIMERLEQVPG